MSLFRQLAIMLTLFLGIILALVMVLNFKTASEFVQNQLYTDAKNTAHSLGLSLSKVADPQDPSSMDTMINAIFDSGYYQSIRLVDLDGKVVYERHNDMRVSDVPQWFISVVKIDNTSATSDIMIGWSQFGKLYVSGHTGNAYRQLYSTFINLIETFLIMGIVVFALLYLLLSLSLQSLKRIRDQAQAIIDNQFIFEDKIPFTTEFRSVSVAMNATVGKVKDIFERENETLRRYHELLYKDSETKLYNRRYLISKLPDYLQADTSNCVGMYALCSFDELDRFKREFGYEAYHQLMIHFSGALTVQFATSSSSMIARLNESDFFIVLPTYTIHDLHAHIQHVMEEIKGYLSQDDASKEYLILGCAIGDYSEKDTLKSLFSRADYSVTQAKLRANFTIDVTEEKEDALVLGREEWRQEILLSLEESRMLLAFQSVVHFQDTQSNVLHEEIFLRLLDREGSIHSAGYFIPVATSLGLMETLDQYMITKVLKHLVDNGSTTSMALNLSADFITKYSNVEWLKEQLNNFSRHHNTTLWFEVSNSIALSEIDAVKNISLLVKSFNHRFGIDHFAIPEGGAEYLQVIRPDYVKSNAAYLSDMMIDKENGNSRESFSNLAKSLGISIIAMMIENKEEMEELHKLGLRKFQGSFVAPVAMLK